VTTTETSAGPRHDHGLSVESQLVHVRCPFVLVASGS
jgi:hypothetical protein